MAASTPEHRPKQFVSSGLPGLDSILEGLRIGDNVVWRVDRIDDYRAFVAPYVAAAMAAGRRVVYIRFASHAPVVGPDAVSAVYNLDAYRGFESFTVHLHTIIGNEGAEVFYVMDASERNLRSEPQFVCGHLIWRSSNSPSPPGCQSEKAAKTVDQPATATRIGIPVS